ncbi:hypothetical protein BGX29_003508 [Mortierella sp. GBA35]|nr:hypothetical protein BGX29_003508 [Mortierella sp. GBA35]
MDIHPLILPPEIILAIGKSIPLWIWEQVRDEIHQVFTPKDLVALSSVNRLFYSVLTPLLWATYHEPTYKPHDPNLLAFRPSAYFYSPPALDVVSKNSPYFRSLDLSNHESRYFRKPELLKLKCTHLQELQLSPNVSLPLARKLIKDNPGLRMLDWKRSLSIDHSSRHYAKLDTLLSLHQLRYLGLEGWNLDSSSSTASWRTMPVPSRSSIWEALPALSISRG